MLGHYLGANMSRLTEARDIKRFETERSEIIYELQQQKKDLDELKADMQKNQGDLTKINSRIEALKLASSDPVVTEHAMLRYLERVKGVDLAEIEAEILNKDTLKLIEKFGHTGVYSVNGCKIKLVNNAVVTIISYE